MQYWGSSTVIERLTVYEWQTKEKKKTEILTGFLLWKDMDEMPRASFWAILKGHVPACGILPVIQ